MPVLRLALIALGVVAIPLAAQHGEHEHDIGRLGHVSFPVTCAAEAPARFERAMAVLHSFWWGEGGHAFAPGVAAGPFLSAVVRFSSGGQGLTARAST